MSAIARPLGIFSDIAPGSEPERAAAIAASGFQCVQLRVALSTEAIDGAALRAFAAPYRDHGLAIAAVAGYTNLVHPDPAQREAGLQRLERLLAASAEAGCGAVCTETGSRHAERIRPDHPANTGEEAWRDLVSVARRLIAATRRDGGVLAIEGYVKNVGSSLGHLRRLAAELPELRYVCDPFNLVADAELPEHRRVFADIVEWMAPRVAVAHAKDVQWSAGELSTPRAGTGQADWGCYARLLDRHLPGVPLILEHVRWPDVAATREFVAGKLRESSPRHLVS